eukprot:Seg940.12 transcript_id=Seg940.12/GoldUCD/mRNA.D3Y31 product="Ras-related protein RABE1a" protein_id=Seg940.12/GoldUCD/D3Y31
MTLPKDYDVTFKMLVLGDSGVGKTCLIRRFTDNDFTDNFLSTIGIDSKAKIVPLSGMKVRLQIWDTAGQERFRTLTSAYFRGAMGIMLVYDVTSESSFNNVNGWLENIDHNAAADVCKIMVGNKSDANLEEREITEARGKERAEECCLPYYEASAKTGNNVTEAFLELASQIKQQKEIRDKQNAPKDHSPFSPTQTESKQQENMSLRKKNYDVTYKVLVLGESTVGKTALIKCYTESDKEFDPNLVPTIGIDYRTIFTTIDNLKIRTQIWDTAGQERFRTMNKMYFRGAKGILLLYDITNKGSYLKVTNWMQDLKEVALKYGIKFKETSAKTTENVNETFEQLIYNMKDTNDPFTVVSDVGNEDWEKMHRENGVINDLKEPVQKEKGQNSNSWCCSN